MVLAFLYATQPKEWQELTRSSLHAVRYKQAVDRCIYGFSSSGCHLSTCRA